MTSKPYVIGITGGSASGKTTVANGLAALLADLHPAVLHQDRYFRDFSRLSPEEREREATANRPESMLWPAFMRQVELLLAGHVVYEPVPDTRLAARGAPRVAVEPGEILIVEGLFALWDEALRAKLDLKVFVEVDDDERVLRRLARDIVERGGTVESVIAWYRKDVWPNYPKYTGASRRVADVIVLNNESCQTSIRLIAAGVRQIVRERRASGG